MAKTETTTKSEPTWPELLGSKNWDGLLNPLDLSLRNLILRCGDFCQATYDAFNNDENSKYAGSSRYGKKSFFEKTMLDSASDYQVHCFLYATAKVDIAQAVFLHSLSRESWDRESNWIGYVAVTSDAVSQALGRREIYGWLNIYVSTDPNSTFTKLSARMQLLKKIQELRDEYKNESLSITLTGHSLGACLAILSAFDLVENGANDIPVSAIVFGSPQRVTGVQKYRNRTRDRQQKIPESEGLEESSDWHNLQAMLHVVAGWNGPDGEFELKVKRSLALVNKSSAILKDEYLIPGSWWVEKNKGLVRDENGEWILAPPSDEDQPVPEF
ncbi:hypothetical protein DH2020_031869 [Rehmannia glutinosa]|uniref:Phospholipase A1 n=1 Tax=Rehmannia glutinosa TaxID=99300 RepID=A0ABR0VKS4_REHGL